MREFAEFQPLPIRKRDRTAAALLAAMALALAVATGVSFSAAATGALHEVMKAVGFGRGDVLAAEQRRQAAEIALVQNTVDDLRLTMSKLERTHPNLSRELIRLQARLEKSGQTDIAIINRIGGLVADIAGLNAEMVAVRGAANEAAGRAETAVTERFARIDTEITALKREVSSLALDVGEGAADAPWRAHVDDLTANLARAGIEIGALRSTLDARDEARRAEAAAQRADITEIVRRVERLEHIAARELTGSVRNKASRKHQDQRALSGWSVQTAGSDFAVIANDSGTFTVKPGTVVPGLGRVSDLRQRGNRWVVVTDRGVIPQR